MRNRLHSQSSSARQFVLASTQLLSVASVPVTGYPLTMFCWWNPDAVAAWYGLISLSNGNTEAFILFANATGKSSTSVKMSNAYTHAASSQSLVAGEWHGLGGVYASSTSRANYFNGVADGTSALDKTPGAVSTTYIGAEHATLYRANGRLAHAAIWNVALTAQEMQALGRYRRCPLLVRPSALVFYAPLCFAFDGDIVGYRWLVPTNAPTWGPGPPGIIYPRPTWQPAMAAAVAGGFQPAWAASSNAMIGA